MQVVISHLTKRFGQRLVLDDVSLAIAAGADRGPDRSQRGRQVDAAPLDQRPEHLRRGRDPRRLAHAAAQSQPSRLSGARAGAAAAAA